MGAARSPALAQGALSASTALDAAAIGASGIEAGSGVLPTDPATWVSPPESPVVCIGCAMVWGWGKCPSLRVSIVYSWLSD